MENKKPTRQELINKEMEKQELNMFLEISKELSKLNDNNRMNGYLY